MNSDVWTKNSLLVTKYKDIHLEFKIFINSHKNLGSLDHYIHLAKSELTNMSEVLNNINQSQKVEAKEREQKRLLEELKLGNIDLNEYIKNMELLDS